MRTWGRFWALNASDRHVIAEAAALLCAARCGLAFLPYQALRRSFGLFAGTSRLSSRQPVERIVWAVQKTASRLPFQATCVVQALAADTMLRRRGYSPDIRFGVRSTRAGASRLEAHAWLDLAGVVVLGHVDQMSDYLEMSLH